MPNKQPQNPIELITIEQNFPYSDPETAGTKDNWKALSVKPYAELEIGQGRHFYAAKQHNVELQGIVFTNQYLQGLTNDKQFRVICSRGTFDVMWIIDLREQNKNEIHLKQIS